MCLASLAFAGRAADDVPPKDAPSLPTWFKELVDLVETNSPATKVKAEAKLTEARRDHDSATEAYALLMLSHVARRQNDIPTALTLSRAALDLAEPAGADVLRFNTNYGHALNLRAAGDHATAIEFLLRSLRLADARLSPRAQSTAVAALGASYEHLDDLKHALDYKQRTLALAEQLGDQKAIGMYAHNLASLEEKLGDPAAARRDYNRALAITRAEGNRTNIADEEEQLAMLDFTEGHAEAALAALQPILAQRRTLRGKVKLITTLGYLAEVLAKLHRLDEALARIEEARGYADAIESRGVRANVYRRLAVVQEARGDFAAALAAARREFAEREAMAGETAQTRVAELQVQFDVAKKDSEIARLARENELHSVESRAHAAQLAQNAAELRAKDAELHATAANLARVRSARLALGAAAFAGLAVLGAIVAVQRTRIRAERRVLADTRAARDTAQQADALKSQLLGFASHDLKAPLANMSAATHLIEESAADASTVRSLASKMRAEASRMIHLVHDFIDRAALDTGRLELRPEPVDLAAVVARVAEDFRARAMHKNQTLTIEATLAPLPRVSGEATRLEQVFANLVSNAVNYTSQHGTIRIVLGHDTTGVWCEVRDSGPGIAPADRERLFQPFSRLAARPTGGESSSGLGLHLARELVQLHGGTIAVQPESGAGAVFRVTLPALPDAHAAA